MDIKKIINILFLLSSMFITFLTGLTHYDSTNSPDFARYFYSYNSYFTGVNSQTGLEQGNLYYFLVSKFISSLQITTDLFFANSTPLFQAGLQPVFLPSQIYLCFG